MKICIQKLLLIALIFSLASCGTSNKIGYFRDLDHSKINNSVIANYSVTKIQPGDLLAINVTGNKESVAPYNPVIDNPSVPGYGYRVNQAGEVTVPIIGVVKAAGLTTDELKAKLLPLILPGIGTGDVSVRLINFKISVLGDVARPNQYTISENEHINILEALALAGDLNVTAKRDDIILIREEGGVKHTYPINLGTKKLLDLPYYYLQNNDIIYVDATQQKADQVDNKSYRTASLVLSALSVAAVLVSLFYRR